jgi:hypothetical protein
MSETEPVLVGRYRLLQQIGAGGMGVVWRAYDQRLGRDVAVKRLHARAGLDPAQAEVWSHRAMREARITARLHHPHAVPVFDVVEHDGQPCLVMQYFPSRSLAELLAERGRMPVPEVARIGAEVASALAAAHRAGIVHRDVKPANVLIAPDGTARITDFGIAHALGDVSLTTTGMVTGTPAYLAPEVARGGDASPASDVFSLGSTLYTALEGHPPFGTSENAMALLHLVASGDVVPPERAGAVSPLLVRMLTADPASRPTMDEVAAGLSAPGDPSPAVALPADDEATAPSEPPPVVAALPVGQAGGLDLLWPPREDESADGDEPPPPDEPVAREGTPPPGAGGGSTRGRGPLVLLGVIAVAAALGLGLPALRDDRDGAAEPTTAATTVGSTTPTPSTARPATSSAPATRTPTPTPTPSRVPSTPAPASPVTGTPTAGELARAVTSYYALLPGDLDAAWDRLTRHYQRTTAKNRSTFGSFWGDIERVRATDVDGSPPGTVTATITYDFDDGRRFVERTGFRLVEDDGVLKIDRSEVLSSVQK